MPAPSNPNPIANPIIKGTSMMDGSQLNQWYPTVDRLQTPEDHARVLKQVLDQHYALQQQVNQMMTAGAAAASVPKGPPPGSGPTDTQLLGLRVAPVDTQKLANGATLKWNSTTGMLEFV